MVCIVELDVIYTILQPYLTVDYLRNGMKSSVYILDNNVMTDFAYCARTYPDDFEKMLDVMNLADYDIVIPSIVLTESGRNNHMDIERYLELYQNMYHVLAMSTNIFIVDTEDAYRILKDGHHDTQVAWNEFQLIAMSLNKSNLHMTRAMDKAQSVQDIHKAFETYMTDAGERQAHLIACSVMMNGVSSVTLLSNEEKGVYYQRTLFSQDETLLETMRIMSQDIFLETYLLYSFDCILYKTMKMNDHWALEDKKRFLYRNRRNNNINRKPRIKLSASTFDTRQLSNDEFANLIHNNPSAQILF